MSELTLAGYLKEKTAPIMALINEIVSERDALRKRNEKLEKVAEAAKGVVHTLGYALTYLMPRQRTAMSSYLFGRYAGGEHVTIANLRAALSDLDKEEE